MIKRIILLLLISNACSATTLNCTKKVYMLIKYEECSRLCRIYYMGEASHYDQNKDECVPHPTCPNGTIYYEPDNSCEYINNGSRAYVEIPKVNREPKKPSVITKICINGVYNEETEVCTCNAGYNGTYYGDAYVKYCADKQTAIPAQYKDIVCK